MTDAYGWEDPLVASRPFPVGTQQSELDMRKGPITALQGVGDCMIYSASATSRPAICLIPVVLIILKLLDVRYFWYVQADPLEQLIQAALVTFRSVSEKLVDMCPMCRKLTPAAISGRWHISYMSKNLLITTINDLNRIIDRLQTNQPISIGKSLSILFASKPDFRCADITSLFHFYEFLLSSATALL
ncbi:unnamed protein product [Gongylonema pulchrum]|uniref:Uncharacterized protein n=1 Tax=Gongylonema pulchrum TaxID=637853 RepID=A0A183CYM4_9BILA|nr:unnamed protein product [Gongylonema pulchrum]